MIAQKSLSEELPADCKAAAHWWYDFGFNVAPMNAATKHTSLDWAPWLARLALDGHAAIDATFRPEDELCAIVDSQVFVLDADTPESLAALVAIEKAHDLTSNLIVRTRNGEHHYYRKAPGTYARLAGYSSKKAPRNIDVRTGRTPTEGRGVIVLPPSSGKVVLVNEADNINDLVEVGQKFIDAVFRHNEPGKEPPRPIPPRETTNISARASDCEAREILSYIDPGCGYDDWMKVVFAIHDHYQGGEEGLYLADLWSQPASNYCGFEEIEYKWRSCSSGKGIGWGTACHLAEENGADLAAIHKRHKIEPATPHAWLDRTTTLSLDALQRRPEPREILCGYFPVDATSAIVAGGNTGKSTWATRTAALNASDDLHVLFVTAEDGEADYQAKLHNLLYSHSQGGRYTDREPEQIAGKVHVLNLKGEGVKLVAEAGGSFVPSAAADNLADFINKHYPRVRVIFFETLSRFAGGEDNDRMEAIVSACDRIAIAIKGACVLIHHVGKSQARDKVIDLYTGRGGSTLGDNTRSFVVLTRLDGDYTGNKPALIGREDIEAGKAFEVYHVRNSYGPTREPEYFVTRSGYCHAPVLEWVPVASEAEVNCARLEIIKARYNKSAIRLHEVIKSEGGSVHRKYFETETREKIGISQAQGRQLIEEMLNAGSLAVEDKRQPSGQNAKVLVIRNHNRKGV